MANELIESMLPVYFPKREKGQREEEYNAAVGANQDNTNRNFATLYNALVDVTAKVKALEEWANKVGAAQANEGNS